ncbi:hypothetical protein [Microbispora sp. CA-102843]|uniref:hypothetical protein n=1 Tax=Microbispora sp. CA-102843 TaxID=3239952 RepID=UPI003D8AA322
MTRPAAPLPAIGSTRTASAPPIHSTFVAPAASVAVGAALRIQVWKVTGTA